MEWLPELSDVFLAEFDDWWLDQERISPPPDKSCILAPATGLEPFVWWGDIASAAPENSYSHFQHSAISSSSALSHSYTSLSPAPDSTIESRGSSTSHFTPQTPVPIPPNTFSGCPHCGKKFSGQGLR